MRLIEAVISSENEHDARAVLEKHEPLGIWIEPMERGYSSIKAMFEADDLDPVLDELDRLIELDEESRVMILPVVATLPRIERPETQEHKEEESSTGRRPMRVLGGLGVSREELYTSVTSSADLTRGQVALIAMSAVVTSGGLLEDSVAMVIGGMVIAPLIGPNVSLALATTLGDLSLGRRAIVTAAGGVALAVVLAVAIGMLFAVETDAPQIRARTDTGLHDLAIALAAGAAAAIAVTTGASTTLVGVMVAVALVPPAVAAGLLLGDGHTRASGSAALLLLVNIVSINLAATSVFLLQGVRPANWWEERKAQRALQIAVPLWLLALAVLGIGVWLAR